MSSIYMGYNPAANQTAREMNKNNAALNKALTSLTTGNRINTAGDDAAGYTIGKNMEVKITGMKRAVRNANDAISAFQVLGGSLKGLTDRVARLQELATQANSSFNGPGDIANIKKEVSSLISGIDSDAKQANFNGVNLMEKERKFSVQVGDSATDMINLNVEAMTTKDLALDKIDFSVFSSESQFYKKEAATASEAASGSDTEVAALDVANIKNTAAFDVADFFTVGAAAANKKLDVAINKTLTELQTELTTKNGKIFALKDSNGIDIPNKIAIENNDGTQYLILDLTTTIDATGKSTVSMAGATTTNIVTKAAFDQNNIKGAQITATTGFDTVAAASLQANAANIAIADTDVKFAPNAVFTGTTLPTGGTLRQVLNGSGEVVEGELMLVIATTDPTTQEVTEKAYKVTVDAVKVKAATTASAREMTLTIGEKIENTGELSQANTKESLLSTLKTAYDRINEVSSTVGATITGLNNTIESLSTNIANTSDAHARIIKADIIETYSEAASRKVQQQAIAQAMQMSNSLTEIALQAMR